MSHQEQPCPVVINPQTIKQVIDWLLPPTGFAHLAGGKMATGQPRRLAAAAVLWATSELRTVHARFVQARKLITKVFRWRGCGGFALRGLRLKNKFDRTPSSGFDVSILVEVLMRIHPTDRQYLAVSLASLSRNCVQQ
jgi:hypothetical protein